MSMTETPLGFLGMPPGLGETIIVLVILLLVFGRRLPEVMRNLGKGLTEFKRGMREPVDEVKKDLAEDAKGEEPPPPSDPKNDSEKPTG